MLLERKRDVDWRERVRGQRADVVELREAQARNEAGHGNAAEVGHRVRRDGLGCAGEEEAALAGGWLRLHAYVLGVEVFRAGVHGAEVALAAIERARDDCVWRAGEAEGSHRCVGLDGVPDEITRAEFRAEAALVAGRASDAGDLGPLGVVALDEVVGGRQDDDAAGGFGNGDIEASGGTGHHDAAEQDAEVRHGGTASSCDDFANGDANGDAKSDRIADGSSNGEVFVCHRLIEADVHQGLYIGDEGACIFREAARRDDAAGDEVDEDEFVSGWVNVGEGRYADIFGGLLLEGSDDVVVLLLDADDAFGGANHLHGCDHAAEKWLGVVMKEFLVLVQERLALSGVGDHQGDAGAEFDGCWEASATCSDDAEFGDACRRSNGSTCSQRCDLRHIRI